MRKIVLMSSAAFVASMFAASGARAATPKVDVSMDTIQCETVIATMGVKPPLSFVGDITKQTAVKVKGTLAGCTVAGANPATVLSGKIGGTLTTTTTGNNCLALIAPVAVTGDVTVTWKADKTTPLLQPKTIIHVNLLSGGIFQGPGTLGTNLVAQFTLSASGADGAFLGGDLGATSTIVGATSESVLDLGTQCGTGIKKIHLGLGELTAQ